MTAGSTRKTAWRLAFAIAAVGAVVFLFGLTVGIVFPGASNPLNPTDGGQVTDGMSHENPSDLQEEGELTALERRLASDIARRAESGAINLTQDDYELAREQVGGENVDALLGEYNNVASDSGDGEQSRSSKLAQSQVALANYTEQVSAYWELYERYEQLTGTGPYFGDSESVTVRQSPQSLFESVNKSTARILVEQLDQRAERVDQTAPTVIEAYEELASVSEDEYTRTIDALERGRESVLETQETIFDEQYTQTSLTARANESTVKATETIELQGRFTESDGTPIATEQITVTVGGEPFEVTTNESGWFTLAYRPLQFERNATELTVEHDAAIETPYLSSETTVNVTVEPVEATVQAAPTTEQMDFNDTVSVTGYIFVQNRPLANVSYSIFVDGEPLIEDMTTADGLVDTEFEVPATVESGQQQLTVKLPEGTVLLSENATSTVNVSTTPTTMAVDVTEGDGNTIQVNGSLRAESGVPVTGQLINLSVGGETTQIVVTDENGTFDDKLVVPGNLVGDMEGTVTITVSAGFDGVGTNLQSVSETTQLSTQASNLDGSSGSDGTQQGDGQQGENGSTLMIALLAVLATGLVAVGYLVYRFRGSGESETTVTDENDATPKPTETPTGTAFESGLDSAIDLLDSDRPEAAVRASYAALRQGLAGNDESSRIQTHWEFYQEYRERLDSETEAKLRAVTESYERVAFAGESADTDMAQDVVDAVRSLGMADEPVTDGGTEREKR